MAQKLEQLGVEVKSAELKHVPLVTIPVPISDVAKNVMRLIDMLDEDEDVNAVYHNMDLSEEVEAELAKG
jgi:transcriptional/translational regulatory protein YebC/TACO1